MSYRRQSSGNPSYPSLAWNLAIALCMIDKKTINVDREYSTKQFADVMNEAHEDMEVCGNLLGHALIEFSNILFRSVNVLTFNVETSKPKLFGSMDQLVLANPNSLVH